MGLTFYEKKLYLERDELKDRLASLEAENKELKEALRDLIWLANLQASVMGTDKMLSLDRARALLEDK